MTELGCTAFKEHHLDDLVKVMTCPEIILNRQRVQVRFQNFSQLHSEGKKLINGWFRRAWDDFQTTPNEVFEPFIFLWFAFNGWAACVTDRDKDFEIINALAANPKINEDFKAVLGDTTSELSRNATSFSQLLPIFDVKTLRQRVRHVPDDLGQDRAGHVRYYIENGANRFQPQCWMRHIEAREELPIDWPHLLKPIYKVRCNLFHGQKSAHSEMDQRIVSAAFLTLMHFLRAARYLDVQTPSLA
jgi:hypothetical protein